MDTPEQSKELTIHVKTGVKKTNKDEVLQDLTQLLVDSGNVESSYINAVIEREKEYATGLRLGGEVNVALAHADIIHVKKSGFALAILENPIEFNEMGNPEGVVPVYVIFVMAAVDPKSVIGFIERLTERVFMNNEVMKQIYTSGNENVIKDILYRLLISDDLPQ